MENWRLAWATERDPFKKKIFYHRNFEGIRAPASRLPSSSQEKNSGAWWLGHSGFCVFAFGVLALKSMLAGGDASVGRELVLRLQLDSGGQSLQFAMCLCTIQDLQERRQVISGEMQRGLEVCQTSSVPWL